MTAPHRRRLGTSHWAVVLAGPVVGTVYFFLVYLLAEASCADELELLSTTSLRIVIIVAAAASIATLLAFAWRARQLWQRDATGPVDSELAAERRANGRFMVFTGLLLLGMFMLLVLFLTAPSLSGSLC